MPRFFCDGPIRPDTTFALAAEAAQHVRVLRLRPGERIVLFDGRGGETPATLITIDKREVSVRTAQHVAVEREAARAVTLFAALIANDRMDWMIQKATELGAAGIHPLITERSQRIPGAVEKRLAHWRGVVLAACEQCGRNQLPTVHAPLPLADALLRTQGAVNVLLDGDDHPETSAIAASASLNVFVGPEGGFTPRERETLLAHGASPLAIGAAVLRAETAAIAALARLAHP